MTSGPEVIAGRYRLDRPIGRGATSTVHAATDLRSSLVVAVKMLRPEIARVLGSERFLREIRISGSLVHPHIVPLLDSGISDDRLYCVMPFIGGESLRDRLSRERQLPLAEAVRIATEVALALESAHGLGVIHRDIKPENILLEPNGRALVADFGLARVLHSDDGLSTSGLALGTPYYMSPEQAAADKAVDERTDLYSLGCVLYEMLAGEHLYSGSTPQVVAIRHAREPVPHLEITRPDAPPGLQNVLNRALAKVPGDRFQSAAEFRETLVAATNALPSMGNSRPPTVRFPRRLLVGVLAGGAVLTAWLVWALTRPRSSGGAVADRPALTEIAVRPFEDLSGGALTDIARGLTVDLAGELAAVPGLQVRSVSTVSALKDATPSELVRSLRIGTLVEGTLVGNRDSLRVSVSLVDPVEGSTIANVRLARPVDDVFGLQVELVREVSRFLRTRLGRSIDLQQRRQGTRNVRAWEDYQRGDRLFEEARDLRLLGQRDRAITMLFGADSAFSRAAERDARWVDPVLAAGWVAERLGAIQPAESTRATAAWLQEGIRRANAVLARSPGDLGALELRGTAAFSLTVPPFRGESLQTGVEADLRAAAVAGYANRARALNTLSAVFRTSGRSAEAFQAADEAYRVDAFLLEADEVLMQLCSTSLELNRVVEAARWCNEGQVRFPVRWEFPYYQLTLHALPNGLPANPDSAWVYYRLLERLTPPSDWPGLAGGWRMMVAAALARSGLRDSAVRVIAASRRIGSSQVDLAVYDAAAQVALAEPDSAIALLSGYLGRFPQMRPVVEAHPAFQSLRGRPAFNALVAAR